MCSNSRGYRTHEQGTSIREELASDAEACSSASKTTAPPSSATAEEIGLLGFFAGSASAVGLALCRHSLVVLYPMPERRCRASLAAQ
jgi:hypothetical protein